MWDKLKFAPARGLKAPLSTPRLVNVISLETVVYGAAPHGKTRYNLASPTEASQRVGQSWAIPGLVIIEVTTSKGHTGFGYHRC